MADAAFIILLTVANAPPPVFIPGTVLVYITNIWILRRFGLLSFAALACTGYLAQSLPFAAASWYAALSLTTPLIFALVAAWSLYAILASRLGAGSHSAVESRA